MLMEYIVGTGTKREERKKEERERKKKVRGEKEKMSRLTLISSLKKFVSHQRCFSF